MEPARTGLRRKVIRRGGVAVMVAVCLTILMAVAALAIDGGNLLDEQRQCQAIADAAAMAAACQLYANYATDQGKDPSGTAYNAAIAVAQANGFNNDGVTNKVYVNIPPKYDQTPWSNLTHQPYKGVDSYVEVILEHHEKRGFSRMLGSSDLIVRTRAVARGAWKVPHAGVLLLQYSGTDLQDVGNAQLGINGGDLIIDSNSSAALVDVGNATVVVNNGQVDITGNDTGAQAMAGTIGSGAKIQTPNGAADVYINQHPTPDPLAYLPAPGGGNGVPNIPPTAPNPKNVTLPDGTQAVLLYPGSYGGPGQPTFPSNSSNNGPAYVLMQATNPLQGQTSGIYYIRSGDFSFRNTTVLSDNNLLIPGQWNGPLNYQGSTGGVMIYMATGAVSLQGNPSGFVYFDPLASGPYSGLVFWQDRANTNTDKITGNGSFTINGTFYAPSAFLQVGGNGGTYTGSLGSQIAGSQVGSQFIASSMKVNGNGNVVVNYQGPPVAKTRILCLVE